MKPLETFFSGLCRDQKPTKMLRTHHVFTFIVRVCIAHLSSISHSPFVFVSWGPSLGKTWRSPGQQIQQLLGSRVTLILICQNSRPKEGASVIPPVSCYNSIWHDGWMDNWLMEYETCQRKRKKTSKKNNAWCSKIDEELVENFFFFYSSPDKNWNLLCEALICWEHGGMKRKIHSHLHTLMKGSEKHKQFCFSMVSHYLYH